MSPTKNLGQKNSEPLSRNGNGHTIYLLDGIRTYLMR